KRLADARNELARPLWLAEEIWPQLLEFWASLEFQAQSAKNKINHVANPEASATVYCGGSSSVGVHKRKLETHLGGPVNQMQVFEKVYKKKNDRQSSSLRAEKVAEAFLRLLRECQEEENNSEKSTPSSQASVTLNDQQMSVADGRLRGPPHDCWTNTVQQLHCSYALATTATE
ncbi:UNVERIFIED_CONTAM: hypothetical protein Sangu_3233300, partial [Sesamum angustifolium]